VLHKAEWVGALVALESVCAARRAVLRVCMAVDAQSQECWRVLRISLARRSVETTRH
jgi:hypothetical protein